MDFRLDLENKTDTYTNGDLILGKINIFCAQKTTISELTATLIGESTSSLSGVPGLLFSRREEEKHVIVREGMTLVPPRFASYSQKARPLRLDVGCHSFDFRIRIPEVADCSTCPSNSPVDSACHHEIMSKRSSSSTQFPPSTREVQSGNEITYRVDVIATTIRNMFRSRTMKSCSITVWPVDSRLAQRDCDATTPTTSITARATVLGPNSLPLPSCGRLKDVLGLAPAEILITAFFQPDFNLASIPHSNERSTRVRALKMDLSVAKLKQHPQDLYLQSFQVLLVGYTDIRAGAATHGHMSFWTLQSLSNIGLQVFSSSDAPGAERDIDPRLWDNVVLDDSVVPDFATCNLERRYELEVLMGWQCQSGDHAGRVFFVQLRTPVRIASGILPRDEVEKTSLLGTESYLQAPSDNGQPRTTTDEQIPLAYARLEPPPTYDDAVRAAVVDGFQRYEVKGAGGW